MLLPPELPVEDLEAVLAPFGAGVMLPGAAYTSSAVLRFERDRFFDGGWVCLGRSSLVGEPGAQMACRAGGGSVLAVRQADGHLSVYANLCRHRGHELLAVEAGCSRPTIVCPYHGWVYDLNGSLRSAPKVGDVAAFEPTLLGLTELPSREWGGWIWVNAAGAASPLEQVHLPFHEIATRYRPEGLAVGSVHRYELAANWKLVHENYQECYHCPLIHPELSRVTVANSGDNLRAPAGAVVGGSMQLVADTMSFSGRSPLRRLPAVAERGADDPAGQEVWYLSVFPSLLVAFHPDYVLTHRLEPVAPDRTIVECTWLFDPDAMAQPEFDPGFAVDFWDVVNRQDWAAIESVQRSMGSPHFRPGIIGHSEDAVWQFETLVAAGYLGRNLVPLPLPSSYRR